MKEDPPLSTTELSAADGLRLFCRSWPAETPSVATLVIVHGLGEHSGRYDHVAAYFNDKGYSVFALDLRGHGQSQGKRGHVDAFDDYVSDVLSLVKFAHAETPDVPLFLLGHSMGGLIVLNFALKHPDEIKAVIVSNPALEPKLRVPPWKATLGNLLANILPKMSLDNGISSEMTTRNQAVIQARNQDQLVHSRTSARWFFEYNQTRAWVMEEANTLAVPILILHSGGDLLIDPTGAIAFFDRVGLDDKHHIEYPEAYHEIFNDPEQEEAFADIEAWLLPRLQPQPFVQTFETSGTDKQ